MRWRGGQRGGGGIEDRRGMGVGGIAGGGLGVTVLALLGFGGAAGTFVGIAKILFFIALAVFVVFLVLGILAGKGVKDAID